MSGSEKYNVEQTVSPWQNLTAFVCYSNYERSLVYKNLFRLGPVENQSLRKITYIIYIKGLGPASPNELNVVY